MSRVAIILGVASLLLHGCSSPSTTVTQRDLVGAYSVAYEPYRGRVLGRETLTLRSDGTFQQVFHPTKGPQTSNVGSWTIDTNPSGSSSVNLYGFVQYLAPWGDKLAQQPQTTNFFAAVYKQGNRLSILRDANNDYYYRKTK